MIDAYRMHRGNYYAPRIIAKIGSPAAFEFLAKDIRFGGDALAQIGGDKAFPYIFAALGDDAQWMGGAFALRQMRDRLKDRAAEWARTAADASRPMKERTIALRALWGLGKAARPVRKTILSLLQDPDPSFRVLAQQTIYRLKD